MPETNTNTNSPDQLFYNVMPKAKLRSDLAMAMVHSPQNAGKGMVKGGVGTKPSRKRGLYIVLIVFFLLALAVGGYYAYKWQENRQDAGAILLPPAPVRPLQAVPPPLPPPVIDDEETIGTSLFETTTPKSWQKRHFGEDLCTREECSDGADPDLDGLSNRDEFASQTYPNDSDTDNDGLSDGDETNCFGSNPLSGRTAGDALYTDADYLKGKYDPKLKDAKLTPERIAQIRDQVKKLGLHEPTITTLRSVLSVYQEGAVDIDVDMSPAAQLDRDAQRLATARKVGTALFAYNQDAGYYPDTKSFSEMVSKIRPYNPIATNFSDPINNAPYVYTYVAESGGKSFLLTYYSETQKQAIRYTAENAAKDVLLEQSAANDDKRVRDLESLRSALLIFSAANSDGATGVVFPAVDSYKSELVPGYLEEMPKDPKTGIDYEYTVGKDYKSFSVKARLENPPAGSTGYLCTEDECDTY